jgi:phage shock protein A
MKNHKYTTTFSSVIKPVVSEDKDKYLALASMVELEKFLPEVDIEKNVDLLPVAFNAFVANRVNKNGDVVDTETAVAMHDNFINKPINIEHNRKSIVGTILTAGFSSFGTDESLTKEQVKDSKEPFNVTLGGVIWKIADQSLADKIESSSDPTSEDYMGISASWELGFSDYNLVVLEGDEKNIENATEISDPTEVEKHMNKLKGFGGKGKFDDNSSVYRKVINDVVPLGIGLTENPAADVQGVLTENGATEQKALAKEALKEETISQNTKNTVKTVKVEAMKIENLKDITDESLQTLTASAIHEFIQESLKKASEDYSSKQTEQEDSLNDTREKHEALSKEHDSLKTQLEDVMAQLNKLEAEKAEKEKSEAFNQRMASFDERFNLDDEDRKVLASQIKDLDEEQFVDFDKTVSVLLSSKAHSDEPAPEAPAEDPAPAEAPAEEAPAPAEEAAPAEASASEVKEVLEQAVDNAKDELVNIPASAPAEEPTIFEKYGNAFAMDQFDINCKF